MDLLAEKQKLVGRTFRHFKMRLSPTAIRLADEQREELLHGKSRKRVRGMTRNMIYHNDFGWRLEK